VMRLAWECVLLPIKLLSKIYKVKTMGVNLRETAHFRYTLWPLSPDLKDEDRKTYCNIRRLYLLGWEGLHTHVYDDGKGFMTVGVFQRKAMKGNRVSVLKKTGKKPPARAPVAGQRTSQ